MRVVEQLILHFWERHGLTRAQADYLVRHGFISADQLRDYDLEAAAPTPEAQPAAPAEPNEAARTAMRPRRGDRRGQERVGPPGRSWGRWWRGYQKPLLARRRTAAKKADH